MMKYMNIMIVFLLSLSLQDVILIKGIPGCPPNRICEINGLDDVVASSSNLPYLITMLHNNCIGSASVAGWNDHVCYDLVLSKSGSLAPYDINTNYADHAFCITKGKGCNRESYASNICDSGRGKNIHHQAPRPCPPIPRPEPCPPHPKPQPCPPCPEPEPCPPHPKPRPCPPCPKPRPVESDSSDYDSSSSSSCSKKEHSSSSSSSSSSSQVCEKSSSKHKIKKHKKCPKYVKQKRVIYKGKKSWDGCKDVVKCAIDNIKIVKTFVFNERDICDNRRIKVKEITDKASNLVKWVELKPILDGKRITKDGYPALLRFPIFLLKFKKYIAHKHKCENICLYLDCCGKLYVRVGDCLYQVRFKKHPKFSRKCAFKYIKLCPIRGKKLNCLIQQGLASIVFERERC